MSLTLCIPPGEVCENPLVPGKVAVPDRSSDRLMDTPSSFFPRMLCRAFNLYVSALVRHYSGCEIKKHTWQGKNWYTLQERHDLNTNWNEWEDRTNISSTKVLWPEISNCLAWQCTAILTPVSKIKRRRLQQPVTAIKADMEHALEISTSQYDDP